jgi:transcriptional antiterminator RfaH
MNWYAIYTKPGKEKSVVEMLGRAGIESYNPRLRVKKLIRRGYRNTIEPLFPCYVFARFGPAKHLWMVNYTRGVRNVVGAPGGPQPVPDEMIGSIRDREKDGLITVRDADIREGDVVRIVDGPMVGLQAVFERPMKGEERAMLLVEALGGQARVVMDRAALVKAG